MRYEDVGGKSDHMAAILSTANYDNVVVIDTQVVLEAKPLEQLPWDSLFQGRTLLLVCRQVQSEIDAKKNDGRLGNRARAFNKLLDTFIDTRVPTALPGVPSIEVALVANRKIEWDQFDDLDRDDGDDRIVAQALHALVDDPTCLTVFSHDMRPRDAAHNHGLSVKKLPEGWLREPEPSPERRRLTELESKVRLLSADQPQISVKIEATSTLPWTYRQIAEADAETRGRIFGARLASAPPANRPGRWDTGLNFDSSFPDRLEAWEEQLREDIPLMHNGLTRTFAQHALRVVIENTGPISAEGLSLEIRSGNAILHAIPYLVLVTGAAAPEPRALHDLITPFSTRDLLPRSREPFVFYWEERGSGDHVILSCASFRQGKSYVCELTLELLETTARKAHVEAIVTAANMKGDARDRALFEVQRIDTPFEEVLEASRGLKIQPPFMLPGNLEEGEFVPYRNNGVEFEEF